MFMQYEQPSWWSPLIIKSFALFLRNIIGKCMSVKILWETCAVDNSSVGSSLMFLSLNFSKDFPNGHWAFSSLLSAFVKPTSDTNDLYSIYDEIRWIVIINSRDDMIPEEFRVSVVGLSATSSGISANARQVHSKCPLHTNSSIAHPRMNELKGMIKESQKLVTASNWCVKAQGDQGKQPFKLVHSTRSPSNK